MSGLERFRKSGHKAVIRLHEDVDRLHDGAVGLVNFDAQCAGIALRGSADDVLASRGREDLRGRILIRSRACQRTEPHA